MAVRHSSFSLFCWAVSRQVGDLQIELCVSHLLGNLFQAGSHLSHHELAWSGGWVAVAEQVGYPNRQRCWRSQTKNYISVCVCAVNRSFHGSVYFHFSQYSAYLLFYVSIILCCFKWLFAIFAISSKWMGSSWNVCHVKQMKQPATCHRPKDGYQFLSAYLRALLPRTYLRNGWLHKAMHK